MAGNIINNSTELSFALEHIAQVAMEKVSEDSLKRLKMLIMMYTYTWDYYPNKYYYNGKKTPTFQFREAFAWDGIKTSFQTAPKTIENTLVYDWRSMKFDPVTFLHGSFKYGDMRENLAELLNVSGVAEGGIGQKERGPYWDVFIDEMFSGNGAWSLDSLFSKYLK